MSKSTDRKRRDREKRRAAKFAKMKTAGGLSVYARKIRGDYPANSPYRGRWSDFNPDGGRASRKASAAH